jgi:hypothetical protein
MKTDFNGNLLWAVSDSVNYQSENTNKAMVETVDNDLITYCYQLGVGGSLIKRDPNGNRMWEIPWNEFGIRSMKKTSDGNIIATGRSGSNGGILSKITNDGDLIWIREIQYTNAGNSVVHSPIDNCYYVTGISTEFHKIFLCKSDSLGNVIWYNELEGYEEHNGYDFGASLLLNHTNNPVLIGNYHYYQFIGVLAEFDSSGELIFSYEFPGKRFLSGVEAEENNYVLTNGTSLMKIDNTGDVIWYSLLDNRFFSGDQRMVKWNHGYLLLNTNVDNDIQLIKTNNSGSTPIEENNLPQNSMISMSSYPNPFYSTRGNITICYSIPEDNQIQLDVYNSKGQKIKTLEDRFHKKGKYSVNWDGKNEKGNQVCSGVYFFQIKSENKITTNKLLLLK